MFTDPFSTVDYLGVFPLLFSLFFWGGGGPLVNTDATTQVSMTPRSSPVYPKQDVVLEEPISEWGSMIPEELGSRNDIFVFV